MVVLFRNTLTMNLEESPEVTFWERLKHDFIGPTVLFLTRILLGEQDACSGLVRGILISILY